MNMMLNGWRDSSSRSCWRVKFYVCIAMCDMNSALHRKHMFVLKLNMGVLIMDIVVFKDSYICKVFKYWQYSIALSAL